MEAVFYSFSKKISFEALKFYAMTSNRSTLVQ